MNFDKFLAALQVLNLLVAEALLDPRIQIVLSVGEYADDIAQLLMALWS